MRRSALLLVLLLAWPLCAGAQDLDPPLPNAGAAGAVQGETWVGRGFAHHLEEAVELNRARGPLHAARSQGASKPVTRRLIFLEQLVRPIAWLTDQRGKKWNKRGVGIVRDDFMPMSHAPALDRPLRWTGRMSAAQQRQVEDRLDAFRARLNARLDERDFVGAARETDRELRAIEALEASWGCHLAMTVHVLEQIGFAAANAVLYVQKEPEVRDFARKFVKQLAWGLPQSPQLDRDAQAAHAHGAGVIVNDVPPIPFRAACRRAGVELD